LRLSIGVLFRAPPPGPFQGPVSKLLFSRFPFSSPRRGLLLFAFSGSRSPPTLFYPFDLFLFKVSLPLTPPPSGEFGFCGFDPSMICPRNPLPPLAFPLERATPTSFFLRYLLPLLAIRILLLSFCGKILSFYAPTYWRGPL